MNFIGPAWIRIVVVVLPSLATPGANASEFEIVHFDGFEDCALAYPDADTDGYGGASGVAHRCDPLPAGFIRTGGDCNDNNSGFNPGVAEPLPDASFLDENCDGIDGDVDMSVFAVDSGAFPPSCGTRAMPCTLAVALGVATATGRPILLSQGNHAGPVNYSAAGVPLRFFGGYSNRFATRSPVGPGGATQINGGPVASVGAYAVEVSAGATLELNDLRLVAPGTAARTAGGAGLSSYGARVLGAALNANRIEIVAGDGASGADGGDGADANPVTAQPTMSGGLGGDGAQYDTLCDTTNKGAAGPAGTNSCIVSPSVRPMNGGAGGAGGTMDTDCGFSGSCSVTGNCDARPGAPGADAAFVSGTAGDGGLGGSGTDSCGPTTPGQPGFVADGSPGTSSAGFGISGSVVLARSGTAGSTGENGGGGGGGGGAGGCDDGTDAYGAGGGGGGAGGCASLTAGGGGQGGGASIGILAVDSILSLSATTIATGIGGKGGDGGSGGAGQAGGAGESGGVPVGAATPGRGGDGGRGGHSGGGGGGGGGGSFGVLRLNVTLTGSAPVVTTGSPGTGGEGGTGKTVGMTGQSGAGGEQAAVRVCASAAGC